MNIYLKQVYIHSVGPGGLIVPMRVVWALEHADVSLPNIEPKGARSISANSMPSQGTVELQFNRIGIGETVVPFMFMK